jgi:ATP phosphoribosyltransferase regulatory subunit HisZ
MGKEKAIETILEKAFKRIQTPTLLPLKTIEPFVHPDHHGQIAKMISPSGEVLALRYDSTLSLVVSEGVKKQNSVYYMEPKFSFDFNKNRVEETMQIGIERFMTQADLLDD